MNFYEMVSRDSANWLFYQVMSSYRETGTQTQSGLLLWDKGILQISNPFSNWNGERTSNPSYAYWFPLLDCTKKKPKMLKILYLNTKVLVHETVYLLVSWT